jgi:hypothetical protein
MFTLYCRRLAAGAGARRVGGKLAVGWQALWWERKAMAIGRGILAFALLGMAESWTATAQTYDELRGWCFQGAKSQEQVLQGCDAVTRSGRESVDDLAVAEVRRGIALRRLAIPTAPCRPMARPSG